MGHLAQISHVASRSRLPRETMSVFLPTSRTNWDCQNTGWTVGRAGDGQIGPTTGNLSRHQQAFISHDKIETCFVRPLEQIGAAGRAVFPISIMDNRTCGLGWRHERRPLTPPVRRLLLLQNRSLFLNIFRRIWPSRNRRFVNINVGHLY